MKEVLDHASITSPPFQTSLSTDNQHQPFLTLQEVFFKMKAPVNISHCVYDTDISSLVAYHLQGTGQYFLHYCLRNEIRVT